MSQDHAPDARVSIRVPGQLETVAATAAEEAALAAAKAAYVAVPSPANKAACRQAQAAAREARWRARGGLNNPYGARTYADTLAAEREQRRTGHAVTIEYRDDGTVWHYGVPEDTGEGEPQ